MQNAPLDPPYAERRAVAFTGEFPDSLLRVYHRPPWIEYYGLIGEQDQQDFFEQIARYNVGPFAGMYEALDPAAVAESTSPDSINTGSSWTLPEAQSASSPSDQASLFPSAAMPQRLVVHLR